MRFDSYSAEWAEFVLMNRYSFCATDIPVLPWHGTFFIIFKKQMNKRQQIEFQYLIEQLVHDMALMLMHDFGYDILSCVSITPKY